MNQYDEDEVIDFAREAVNRFADSVIERATAGLPDNATLTCRALKRIISEERERWLRHAGNAPRLNQP